MANKNNRLRILLVEDNEHDRIAFQRAMNMGGVDCHLTLCEKAEEAEVLMDSADESFDLVVVDFNLPGMNGLKFFEKKKRQKNLPPFIMLTGAGTENIAVKAMQAGFYDYVVKDAHMGYLNLLPVVLKRSLQRHGHDVARRQAKAALKKAKDELEQKVRERTADLDVTIRALETEIEEHRRTEAELEKSEAQLRELSQKIVEAQENERKIIAQEIHDSIGSSLAAIKFALEEKLDLMGQNPSSDGISLEKIISYVDQTIKESRRISANLRPSLLDELGLLATIAWFCREFGKVYPEMDIAPQLEVAEDEIPERLKVVIYRVLQEAMNNAAKHSEATRVHLHLQKLDDRIEFSVIDNGCGFDLEAKSKESKKLGRLGLSGMMDRTMFCGGKFEIFSEKGQGTKIHISLPCTN